MIISHVFSQYNEAKDLAIEFLDTSTMFSHCHNRVHPVYYKKQAEYDLCLCLQNPDNTMDTCRPYFHMAAVQYSRVCALKGVLMDWNTDYFGGKAQPINTNYMG